jgi:uncharacterized phage protein (TIGR01671 family)
MYTVRTLRIDNDGVRMFYLSDPADGEYGNGRGLSIDDFADVELMEYTGLKDKNGKDIYEGDILNLVLGKHILEVRRGSFSFQFFEIAQQKQKLLYASDLKRIEIIGNIYETTPCKDEV